MFVCYYVFIILLLCLYLRYYVFKLKNHKYGVK